MKFAYADPPYIGQARRHYSHDERCAEVNHRVLLGWLCADFDAWALSCSSTSLQTILRLDTCPEDVRVAAWVKPFASFKPGVNPAYTWEPVLFWRPRKRGREVPTTRDYISASITLRKGLSGVKPPTFCQWMFDLMGLEATDEFTDVFPGSGAVTQAWQQFINQPKLSAA